MKPSLVYGLSRDGDLTVVPEAKLRDHLRYVGRVLAARTYGEARELEAPGSDDDEYEADAPFDVREVGLVQDGDWPDDAAMLALRTLPADVRALGKVERSMVGQEWLEFEATDEARLIQAIEAAGYAVRRDDELIRSCDELAEL